MRSALQRRLPTTLQPWNLLPLLYNREMLPRWFGDRACRVSGAACRHKEMPCSANLVEATVSTWSYPHTDTQIYAMPSMNARRAWLQRCE